jgi:phosphatidylglycerol:prolipoprotein diacylglycerol transferase
VHPILLHWGDAVVTTYSLLVGLAFLTGLGFALAGTRKLAIPRDRVVGWSLGCFLWGLIGARLLFLIVQWPLFLSGRFHPWALWEGGVVFYGGLIGALAYLAWALRRETTSRRLEILEALAPAIAFAHAVGRLGCFFNGCCHGSRCDLPWGVTFTDPRSGAEVLGVPLHPTPLYESLGLGLLGGLLLYNARQGRFGSNARLYLVGYGSLRFLLEFTRGDSLRGSVGPLSTSQVLSLAVICLGLILGRVATKKEPL